MQLLAPGLKSSSIPTSRSSSVRWVFTLSNFIKGTGERAAFVDDMLISLALCIIISIKLQTHFKIFVPITQMKKLRHEVTCLNFHLQLVT